MQSKLVESLPCVRHHAGHSGERDEQEADPHPKELTVPEEGQSLRYFVICVTIESSPEKGEKLGSQKMVLKWRNLQRRKQIMGLTAELVLC